MEAWSREMEENAEYDLEEAMAKRLQEEEENSDRKAPRRGGGWGWHADAPFSLVFFIFFWVADLSTGGVVSVLASKPRERRPSLRGAANVYLALNYTTPGHLLNETAIGGDSLQRSHGINPVVSSGALATAVGVHGFKPKEGGRLGGAMKADSESSDATSAHELNQTALDGNFLQRMDGTQTRVASAVSPEAVHITFTPGLGGAPDGGGVWQLHYFDKEEDVKYTPRRQNPDRPNNPSEPYFELLPFSAIHLRNEKGGPALPYTEYIADDPKTDVRVNFLGLQGWRFFGKREYLYATLENACLSFESAKIFAGKRTLPPKGDGQASPSTTPINWPPNTTPKMVHNPDGSRFAALWDWFAGAQPASDSVLLPNVMRVEAAPKLGAGYARDTFGLYRGLYEPGAIKSWDKVAPGPRLRYWVTGFTWKDVDTPCKTGPSPSSPRGGVGVCKWRGFLSSSGERYVMNCVDNDTPLEQQGGPAPYNYSPKEWGEQSVQSYSVWPPRPIYGEEAGARTFTDAEEAGGPGFDLPGAGPPLLE